MKCKIHKYERRNYGIKKNYIVWACVNPHCTHYVPYEQGFGRACECFKCGTETTIRKARHVPKRPICLPCHTGSKEASPVLEELMKVLDGTAEPEETP